MWLVYLRAFGHRLDDTQQYVCQYYHWGEVSQIDIDLDRLALVLQVLRV